MTSLLRNIFYVVVGFAFVNSQEEPLSFPSLGLTLRVGRLRQPAGNLTHSVFPESLGIWEARWAVEEEGRLCPFQKVMHESTLWPEPHPLLSPVRLGFRGTWTHLFCFLLVRGFQKSLFSLWSRDCCLFQRGAVSWVSPRVHF